MVLFRSAVFVGALAAVGAMFYSHRIESHAKNQKIAHVSGLLEAGQGVNDLANEVDRFRDSSPELRKLSVAEGKASMERTHDRFKKVIAGLNRDLLVDKERKQIDAIDAKLDQLIEMSERVATSYSTPDPFRLAEPRDLLAAVRQDITRVNSDVQARERAAVGSIQNSATTDPRVFLIGGGVILFLLLAVYFREYLFNRRPLKSLEALALQIEAGKPAPANSDHLPEPFAKVASVLLAMASVLERQAKERHKFMLDLFSDFALPLSMVRSGKSLISPKAAATDVAQAQAADSVKRGIASLSGCLDDLTDLAEFGNLENRLDERLVDISEVVLNVSRTLTGPDSAKWISTALPAMPVWAKLDARRMERVLTHVILKVAETLAEGEKIHLSVSDPTEASDAGLSILVQGTERMKMRSSIGSGPEVDIAKHWINEKGLFLGLMSKIVRVQGGEITASGVTGTSVQVRIHLPAERLVAHGLINAPLGLRVDLEASRFQKGAASSV